MNTCATDIDVGTELFNFLHEQQCLTSLLSEGRDEDGKPIIGIYRSNVPQFDRMITSCIDDEGNFVINHGYQIDDYLVFEMRDELYEECLSGGAAELPSEVFFDIQIVSDSKRRAIKIKNAFRKAVLKLDGKLCDEPCKAILPQQMCGIHVCGARLTGANENTQRLTAATEFGLSAFDLDLTISPAWRMNHA